MDLNFDPARFELAVIDEDRKLFSVEGPMSNDTAVDRRIMNCRKAGRNLRIGGVLSAALSREENIAVFQRQTGFSYTPSVFVSVEAKSGRHRPIMSPSR